MDCKYFGECGACRVYEDGYQGQLESKIVLNRDRFFNYYQGDIAVFQSPDAHYRSRSEFKIWHIDDDISYGMNHKSIRGHYL